MKCTTGCNNLSTEVIPQVKTGSCKDHTRSSQFLIILRKKWVQTCLCSSFAQPNSLPKSQPMELNCIVRNRTPNHNLDLQFRP